MTSEHSVKGEVRAVRFISFKFSTKEVKLQMLKKGRAGSRVKNSPCAISSHAGGLNISNFMT